MVDPIGIVIGSIKPSKVRKRSTQNNIFFESIKFFSCFKLKTIFLPPSATVIIRKLDKSTEGNQIEVAIYCKIVLTNLISLIF